jgi:hypothetical protein
MSEIQGLGASQNVRPAVPALRTSPARPELPIETPSSFGSDAVQMSGGTSTLPPALPLEAPAPPVRECPPPHGGSARVEEVDGFIVAGPPQVPVAASRSTEVASILAPGPIAVIDETSPEILRFPELSLNGPSTASAGLFSLSGNRLA